MNSPTDIILAALAVEAVLGLVFCLWTLWVEP